MLLREKSCLIHQRHGGKTRGGTNVRDTDIKSPLPVKKSRRNLKKEKRDSEIGLRSREGQNV